MNRWRSGTYRPLRATGTPATRRQFASFGIDLLLFYGGREASHHHFLLSVMVSSQVPEKGGLGFEAAPGSIDHPFVLHMACYRVIELSRTSPSRYRTRLRLHRWVAGTACP